MTATLVNKDGSASEQFSIRVPVGTAKRLDQFKKQHGMHSRNQAVNEILARGFVLSEA